MPIGRSHAVLRLLPFGVVSVFSLLSFLTPGPDLPTHVDIWDKLGHAAMFAGLFLTGRLAGLAVVRLGAALLAYAVLVEVLQASLPIHRSGDWHDVVADLVGLLGGWLLARIALAVGEALRRRPDPPG